MVARAAAYASGWSGLGLQPEQPEGEPGRKEQDGAEEHGDGGADAGEPLALRDRPRKCELHDVPPKSGQTPDSGKTRACRRATPEPPAGEVPCDLRESSEQPAHSCHHRMRRRDSKAHGSHRPDVWRRTGGAKTAPLFQARDEPWRLVASGSAATSSIPALIDDGIAHRLPFAEHDVAVRQRRLDVPVGMFGEADLHLTLLAQDRPEGCRPRCGCETVRRQRRRYLRRLPCAGCEACSPRRPCRASRRAARRGPTSLAEMSSPVATSSSPNLAISSVRLTFIVGMDQAPSPPTA